MLIFLFKATIADVAYEGQSLKANFFQQLKVVKSFVQIIPQYLF